MPAIRQLQAQDFAAVLRINAASVPAVASLDTAELRRLAAIGDLHRVAVDGAQRVLGYLLAFASDADYDGEEFQYFRAQLAQPFLYVDQVAIGAPGRRRGIGRALYESVLAEARRRRSPLLCCEVNTHPPNPDSLAFHLQLGFTPLASLSVSDGRTVALLTRATPHLS
ncbi:MAG: GNAT family N-acetyltransferase [Proteobacteria bacterium]|nr:GNAT family N-acetyltransferase [Pseudomonadota bacterium]